MTHHDAVQEMAVEQYLLGELSGEARNRFEEHLFDCRECAADVKNGVLLVNAAGPELAARERVAAWPERKPSRSFARPWQSWAFGPALAACLAVIVYQSAFLLPRMHNELAQSHAAMAEAQTPTVLTPLLLANAGARGGAVGSLPEIAAPRYGFYLLSVDIPSAPEMAIYRCTLYSPAGDAVWHVDVSPRQAHDTVTIQVPATTAKAGINELRVEGIPAARGNGESPVELAKYKYKLSVAQ